jgi:hypothetical protein
MRSPGSGVGTKTGVFAPLATCESAPPVRAVGVGWLGEINGSDCATWVRLASEDLDGNL